jgi:hypothetical protein
MIERLLEQHIEVSRARAPISLNNGSYPAGTFVVRLDQPYRNYAVDLLTPQQYRKDRGEPYDDVSWELPAHYRVKMNAPPVSLHRRGVRTKLPVRDAGPLPGALRRPAEGVDDDSDRR